MGASEIEKLVHPQYCTYHDKTGASGNNKMDALANQELVHPNTHHGALHGGASPILFQFSS